MIFRQLYEHQTSTYTYLLGDENTRKAAIIDPVKEKLDTYLQLLNELGLKLIAALDTHTHADHITALGKLHEITGCETYVGEQSGARCASHRLTDGEIIKIGNIRLRAIYTPGHTDDSYSFHLLNDQQSAVFTGDTLLIRGTGRTDFQNGSAQAQYHSLFNKLLQLPDNTLVYPGHDYKGWTVSTIAEERQHNPRLQVADVEAYAELMGSLNLAHPKQMDIAVPANLRCGLVE